MRDVYYDTEDSGAAVWSVNLLPHSGTPEVILPILCCSVVCVIAAAVLACILWPAQAEAHPFDPNVERAPEPTPKIEEISSFRIWALTALNLPYGFALAAMGLLVAPLEAQHLWPNGASLALGGFAAIVGTSQLAGPEAGFWSDTYRSSIGRRKPMILIGVISLMGMNFALWAFSVLGWRNLYAMCFFVQQLLWSISMSTQAGLVPDLVPAAREGLAGGCTTSNILGGATAAFLSMFVFSSWDYHAYYAMVNASLFVSLGIVVFAAKERPSLDLPPHDASIGRLDHLDRKSVV